MPEQSTTRLVVWASNQETLDYLILFLNSIPGAAASGVTDLQQFEELVRNQNPRIVVLEYVSAIESVLLALTRRLYVHQPEIGIIFVKKDELIDSQTQRRLTQVGARDVLDLASLNDQNLNASILQISKVQQDLESELRNKSVFRRDGSQTRGGVTTICGAKGGVGKTVLAVNIATLLASAHPNQVLLLDLDLQFGNVRDWLDIPDSARTLIDLLSVVESSELASQQRNVETHVLHRTGRGLQVLLPPLDLLELDLIQPFHLSRLIEHFRRVYPYIIIDTTSYLDDYLFATLQASDLIMVVTTPEVPVLHQTARFRTLLGARFPSERIRFTVNRIAANMPVSEQRFTALGPKTAFVEDDPALYRQMAAEAKTILDVPNARQLDALRKVANEVRTELNKSRQENGA